MNQTLTIRNFRGIQEADLRLAPITVLTGANNAGKSTVMYALVILKNIIANPNQPLDSFFNLGFLNLGGFKPAVFIKDESLPIRLGLESTDTDTGFAGRFEVTLTKHGGTLQLTQTTPFSLHLEIEVTFPYALTGSASAVFEYKGKSYQLTWNGLVATVAPTDGQPDHQAKAVLEFLNAPLEAIRRTDIVPLRRGFTKPVYAASPLTPQLLTEEEIATVLATDSDLLGRVDRALETILNRNLVVFTPPSTATSYLQTRNRDIGTTADLVSEGFGTNQLVFLLAKIHKDGTELVSIEEPEIHLHPSAISRFVDHLARTAKQSLPFFRRHFILSTHSEHLVASLLGLVAKRVLDPSDVAIYYLTRQDHSTVIEPCTISQNGQVKGGLRGFYEAELEAVRNLLQSPSTEQ